MKKRNNIMPIIVIYELRRFASILKRDGFKNIKCLNSTNNDISNPNGYDQDWIYNVTTENAFILKHGRTTLSILYDDLAHLPPMDEDDNIIPSTIEYIKYRPYDGLLSHDDIYFVLDLTGEKGDITLPYKTIEDIKTILKYLKEYFDKNNCKDIANFINNDLLCDIDYRKFDDDYDSEADYYMISRDQMIHNTLLLEKVLDMFNNFDKDDWDKVSIDNTTDTDKYQNDDSRRYYNKTYKYKNAFELVISYSGDIYNDNIDIDKVLLFPDIKNNINFCFDVFVPELYGCNLEDRENSNKTSITNKIITLLKNENKYVYSRDAKSEENLLNTIDEYYKSKKEN